MAAENTTSTRTIRRGAQLGQGTEGAYHRLTFGPGEPHIRRMDLAVASPSAAHRRTLLHFAYSTDIHLLDAESPGRFEFADRYHGVPELQIMLPAYRAHEVFSLQAAESMFRAINAVDRSPITGSPVQFFLSCGDQVDNGQHNELQWFIRLINGGTVQPGSGAPAYEGVGTASWNDNAYWHSDAVPDRYKERWAFPAYPGAHDAAMQPFQAQGVRLPWLICHGNHDLFIQGTAPYSATFEAIVTGAWKARDVAQEWSPEYVQAHPEVFADILDVFVRRPEVFLTGAQQEVTPDPARRPVTRTEWLEAFGAGPAASHGLTAANLEGGTFYYVDDRWGSVRLIVLDTVNAAGDYRGSIGANQLAWLEQQLSEVHSRYYTMNGAEVQTGNADRLVVLVSHHPLHTWINDFDDPDRYNDRPRVLAAEIEAVLHRFPNLILWVNGHVHYNAITPRRDPSGRSAGFWEVTTSSLFDWPGQSRLIEVVDNGDGTLSIFTTMVDHAAPADPEATDDPVLRLAAIHRELAANDPYAGVTGNTQRVPEDRNTELVLPLPRALTAAEVEMR